MTTAILLAIFAGLFILSLTVHAVFLRWGIAWAKISKLSFAKALALALLLGTVNVAISAGFAWFKSGSAHEDTGLAVGELLAQVIAQTALIAGVFRAKILRAFQAWLPTLIPALAVVSFLFLVFRPFVYEAFVAPTNSMAPTILGNHAIGTCPRCGAPAYGRIPTSAREIPTDGTVLICSNERRSCKVTQLANEVGEPDRFLVSKFIAPRRWDVIVFKLPSDPAIYYVKRLVGLPGEELQLRDGALWINGERLEPPGSVRGIEYLSEVDLGGQMRRAAGAAPIRLGADEYFVLGDFSAQAVDSRFWEQGAPGHPPYAVPESHIVGVATHIYWPITRWQILR